MRSDRVDRIRSMIGLLALASLLAPATGAQAAPRDDRPTLAIMSFTNAAIGRTADYAGFSQGISEILMTTLAANQKIRVVERAQLQKLLDEQNLSASGRVDQETAVKLGRILGAHHFIMGAFVIDSKDRMRVDVRSVNVETAEVEYTETVEGKAQNLLEVLDRLGEKIDKTLHLPPLPPPDPAVDKGRGKVDQGRAVLLLGRAIIAKDKGDIASARTAANDALTAYPDFARARTFLASLPAGPP